jgi:hypothetical protein
LKNENNTVDGSGMNMKKIITISILLTLSIFSGGCLTPTDNTALLIKDTGVIEFHSYSDGNYRIIDDNGTVYISVNRNNESFPNGTHVYFEAVRIKNTTANLSSGIPIEVTLIAEYVPPDHSVKINFTKK